MKRTLQITTLLLVTLTLAACDTLNGLISVPPTDYTGTYADTNVDFNAVCGIDRTGEIHLRISTELADDASVHDLTLTTVIFDAGPNGETLTNEAHWRVNGDSNNLNSGAINDFGTINLTKNDNRFQGRVTIYNVECITPAPDPSQPDQITYARISAPFNATAQ